MSTTPINIELPDELPESTSTSIMTVVTCEFALPPERKAMTIRASGGEVRPELHIAYQPKSFRYESDRSMFEDDLEHVWVPVYNRNGDPNGKGSMLDDYFQAFASLGYPINRSALHPAVVGHTFRVRTYQKKLNAEGIKDPWLRIPTEPADDYVAPSPVPVRFRPPKKDAPMSLADASRVVNEEKASAVLKRVLEGKSDSEFLNAILASASVVGADDAKLIICEPFLSEAMNNPEALKARFN